MLLSSTATGIVYPNEYVVSTFPKFAYQPVMPGVSFVHGAGSNAYYNLDAYGNQAVKTLKIGTRYPSISGDNGGPQTWGNNLSITRLGGYLDVLASRANTSGDYALVGDSMGGIVSINYAAQATVKPKAMVLTIPVINIEDIRANNRSGYASLINAAYGGTYVEANEGSTHNPYTMRNAGKLAGIPTLIFYGEFDEICLPEFTEAYIAADPANRVGVKLPYGHEENAYRNVDYDTIMSFLKEHLG